MGVLRNPSAQVAVALLLAVMLGLAAPDVAVQMRPLGDLFIRLMRMLITPVVFVTVTLGLAKLGDHRQLGRVGLRTLIYFEGVSTLALILGFVLVNLVRPGAGLHATALPMTEAVARLSDAAPAPGIAALLLGFVPVNLFDAFARGDIPQVLFVSVLTGAALAATGAKAVIAAIGQGQQVVFTMLGFVMRLAPVGAFGAVAAAVGAHGAGSLSHFASAIALFYGAGAVFVVFVLGGITAMADLPLFAILRLFRQELLLSFSLGSSEAVFAQLLAKLEAAGVEPEIAGFVLPAGYSFNLDGSSLNMAIGLGFIAQATDTPLSMAQQLGLLAVMLLTSKGGAAMPGNSMARLAATLQATRTVPIAGLGLMFGVDRIIGNGVALMNVIGNVVATLVVARWSGRLDVATFAASASRRAGWAGARDATPAPGLTP